MDNQNEINEIKAYFKKKNYLLFPLQYHFYILIYEGTTKIIKIGKAPYNSNKFRQLLATQNTKTHQVSTIKQAMRVVGDSHHKHHYEKLLDLLVSQGREGVDFTIAKGYGVNNLTASVKTLEGKGHNIIKTQRRREDNNGNNSEFKVFYVYAGKLREVQR